MSMSITVPNQGISMALVVVAHARTTAATSTDHSQDGGSNHNLVVGAATYLRSKSPRLAEGPSSKKKLPIKRFSGPVKYKECLKNNAAAIGGSATDGCGKFLAGDEEGTLEALKCSVCNCHRKIQMQVAEEAAAPRTTQHLGGGVLRMKTIHEGEAAKRGEGKKRFRLG